MKKQNSPKFKLIVRTPESIPWGAADRQLVPIDLASYDYKEEEYFFSGQANVYSLADGTAQIKHKNAPYTNRLLVRCPADPARFSGTAFVELINPTNGWDVSPMWSMAWPEILRHGDAYIGITIRPVCIEALKQYDPIRYAPLSFANPCSAPGEISRKILMWQHCSPASEFGLVWDMLTDIGQFLKSSAARTTLGLFVDRVYAMGCSQSAMFLSTYINIFHETQRPSPLVPCFDGYLAFTGSTMVPLNQEEDPPEMTDPIQVTAGCPVPVIRIMSQWDFRDFAGHLSHRRPDSDDITDRFRLYEIAGQAHNPFTGALYRPGFTEMERLGRRTAFPATDISPLPTDAIVRQALRNLDLWSRCGLAAPRTASLIRTDEKGQALPDEYGNTIGGLRLPQLEVPCATYFSGTAKNPQDGVAVMLPTRKLTALYPTHQDYVLAMFAAIDKLKKVRFISEQDAAHLRVEAVRMPVPEADQTPV